jgi:NADH:ubiquinone oxidoreductase subunit 4 (subunit M)
VQYTFLGEYDPHKLNHWTDVETGAELHEPKDVALFEKVTLWPLVAFMIFFGVMPAPLLSFFNTTFVQLMSGFAGK